jgi:hypothetical protein
VSHQLDRVLDDVDSALRQLKASMRGMPLGQHGLKATHDKMARSVGTLTTELSDARSAITS